MVHEVDSWSMIIKLRQQCRPFQLLLSPWPSWPLSAAISHAASSQASFAMAIAPQSLPGPSSASLTNDATASFRHPTVFLSEPAAVAPPGLLSFARFLGPTHDRRCVTLNDSSTKSGGPVTALGGKLVVGVIGCVVGLADHARTSAHRCTPASSSYICASTRRLSSSSVSLPLSALGAARSPPPPAFPLPFVVTSAPIRSAAPFAPRSPPLRPSLRSSASSCHTMPLSSTSRLTNPNRSFILPITPRFSNMASRQSASP